MADDHQDPFDRSLSPDEQSEIWLRNDGSAETVQPTDARNYDSSATRKIAVDDIGTPSLADVNADPRSSASARTAAPVAEDGGQVPLTRRGLRRRVDEVSPEPARADEPRIEAVPIVDPAQPPPGETFPSDRGPSHEAAEAAPAQTDPGDFSDFWNADGRPTSTPAAEPDVNPDPWPGASDAGTVHSDPTTALSGRPKADQREVRLGGAITPLESSSRSLAPVFAALLALLVVGAAILWFFVLRDDNSGDSNQPTETVSTDNSPEVQPEDVTDAAAEAEPSPDPEPAPETTALDATAEVCPDPNSSEWEPGTLGPIVTCPEYPAGQPDRAISEAGTGWIAELGTVALGEPNAVASQNDQIVETIRVAEDRIANVGLYDSRSYSGLPDPFWVLFAGPFPNEASVQEYCEARPHLTTCIPRPLEQQ